MLRSLVLTLMAVVLVAGCEVGSSAPTAGNNGTNNTNNTNNNTNNNTGELADNVAGYWRVDSVTMVDDSGQEVVYMSDSQDGHMVIGKVYFEKLSAASADMHMLLLMPQDGYLALEQVPQPDLFHITLEEEGAANNTNNTNNTNDGTDTNDTTDTNDSTDTGDASEADENKQFKGVFKAEGDIVAHVSTDTETIGDYTVIRGSDNTLTITLIDRENAGPGAMVELHLTYIDSEPAMFVQNGYMSEAAFGDTTITCSDWAQGSDGKYYKLDITWMSDGYGMFDWNGQFLVSDDGENPNEDESVSVMFKGFVWIPTDGQAVFYVFDASADEGVQAMTITTSMSGSGPYSFTVDECRYQGGDDCSGVFPFSSFSISDGSCN